MKLLLRTPDPLPHESLLGFVLRTSEENGYESPWHILALAGLDPAEMRSAAFPIDKLAAVLGKHASKLEAIAYHANLPDGQREYRLLGNGLGRGLNHRPLRLNKPAICVQCIEDDGHIDACWDLSVFNLCPRHHCALVDRCRQCRASLSWFRPGMLTCRCGARIEMAPSAAADPALVSLMAVIQAKVRGDSTTALPDSSGLPLEWLAAVPLGILLRLLQTLASLDTRARGASGAAGILADWPNEFHAYLRRIGAEGVTTSGAGLCKRFGRLHGALFKRRVWGSCTTFLRDEFVRFGENEWGAAVVDPRLSRDASTESRFISSSTLAKRLGVQPVTVRRWIDRGLISATEVATAKARRLVLDARPLDKTQRAQSDCLQQRDAAKYIGLPVSVLQGLRQSGHYSPDPIVNRRKGYWQEDLDKLDARLLAAARRCLREDLDAQKTVSLGQVINRGKFGSDDAKAALLVALLEGKLTPAGVKGTSWMEIFLATSAVENFRLQQTVASTRSAMTLGAAGVILDCSSQAVRALLRDGELARFGSSTTGVARDSVDRFAARWSPTRSLASRLGTTEVKLIAGAHSAGLELLRIRTRGESEALFLKNADLEMLRSQCS